MKRKPTVAMLAADEKRIDKARKIMDAAFNAALTGCPSDMGCGTWIKQHASADLRAAYDKANEALLAAEQSAIERGTMYRGTYNLMTAIRWK
jgi:hypothetical protein